MEFHIKKIIAVSCLLSIVSVSFSPLLANKAEAQGFPVYDNANFIVNSASAVSGGIIAANSVAQTPVKEFALDSIAW